ELSNAFDYMSGYRQSETSFHDKTRKTIRCYGTGFATDTLSNPLDTTTTAGSVFDVSPLLVTGEAVRPAGMHRPAEPALRPQAEVDRARPAPDPGDERAGLGPDRRPDRARPVYHLRPPRLHQRRARRLHHGRDGARLDHD